MVVRKALKASCGTTCCEGVAEAAFPSWAGRQTEAKGLRQGQEAPAASDQAGAEKAAQEGQPEASAVQEEERTLHSEFSDVRHFLEKRILSFLL